MKKSEAIYLDARKPVTGRKIWQTKDLQVLSPKLDLEGWRQTKIMTNSKMFGYIKVCIKRNGKRQ
jgi:hypothetical protein